MLPPAPVLWSFALVVALLTITPGLDTALVLRTAVVAGRRRAGGVISGIQTGTLLWGALAAAGVSAVLAASELLYTVLRIAGAAYLVVIGVRMLVAALRGGSGGRIDPGTRSAGGFFDGWRQGVTTNLLNPKVGAFYVALLPQFIPASAPHLAWGVALAAVHVVLGTVWLTFLVLVARGFRSWLSRPSVSRGIDAVAGAVIVAFGVRLAAEGGAR